MSLQIAAKHLAAKGRGPDTTLVHMTNKEVQGLQALAQKNGGSLSINPDTGLPEAGFLESILPMVAGVGLTAAGMGPMAAALTVGGVSALSTGSLSKGLFAGLGAYGGASLGQQLAVQGMGEAAAANASFGDKLAGMGDASAFSSFENAGKFISANKLPAMAGIAGPLLSSMEDERENDKPSEPVKDTDPGARARSGIKFNPGYMTPTPLPNPYGIEQTYATPYYAAEGGVTHMAEGGMAYGGSTSGPIDTKAQFADYLNKVMNPTNRTNAVSGSTNPYEWWKSGGSSNTPTTPSEPPAETPEEYAERMRVNARGGGGGDREPEDPNSFSAQWAAMSDAEREAWRLENPNAAIAQDAVGLIVSPLKFAYDKLQQYMGPESSTGGPARYTSIPEVAAPTYGGYPEGFTPNPYDMGPGTEAFTNARLAAAQTPYSPSELAGAEMRDAEARNPANWNDAPISAAEAEASQREVDSLGKSNRAAEFGGQTTGFTDGSYTTSLSLPSYRAGDESQLAGDIKDGTVKLGDSVSFDGKQYTVRESDGAIRLTKGTQEGPAALSLPTSQDAVAQTNAVLSRQMNDIPAALSRQERDVPDKSYDLSGSPYASFYKDKDYAPLTTGYTVPAVGAPIPRNILQTQYKKGEPAIGDPRVFPLSADALSTPYDEAGIQALVEQQQPDVNDLVTLRAIKEIYGVDSPIAKDVEAKATHNYNNLNNQINNFVNTREFENAERGDRYPNLPYQVYRTSPYESNFLSRQEKDVPIAVPDIVGINEISADPNADNYAQILKAFDPDNADVAGLLSEPGFRLAAGADYTGGISDGSTFAGIPVPNMGYYSDNQGGRGLGISGLGSVLRSADGTPVRTGDGFSVQTGAGAQQESSSDRVDRIIREAQQAVINSTDFSGMDRGSISSPPSTPDTQAVQNAINSTDFSGMDRGSSRDGGAPAPSAPSNPGDPGRGGGGAGRDGGYGGGGDGAAGRGEPGGDRGGWGRGGGYARGGLSAMPNPYNLGSYSDGGRLLRGPGDGVSDSIPATIGKGRPARLADGEFVIPARIVSEIGNGSTEAGARKLYAMMDRIQASRRNTVGKGKVAVNNRADKYLPR